MVERTAAGRSLAPISSRAASSTPVGTVPRYAQVLSPRPCSIFNQINSSQKRRLSFLINFIVIIFD
jgi:hypothetical protein